MKKLLPFGVADMMMREETFYSYEPRAGNLKYKSIDVVHQGSRMRSFLEARKSKVINLKRFRSIFCVHNPATRGVVDNKLLL